MNISRGERWVRIAGSMAAERPWMIRVFVGAACFCLVFILLNLLGMGSPGMAVFMLFASLFFLLMALIWYERLMFYKVIQELEDYSPQSEP